MRGSQIKDSYPHLVKQLHFGDRKWASQLPKSSRRKPRWICSKGHEWEEMIISRVSNGGICHKCKHPRLAESHPTLTNELHPDDRWMADKFGKSSKEKPRWICKHGHEWSAIILHRSRGVGCPFCAGQRATPQTCLQTTHPELAQELREDYKHLALTTMAGSASVKAWWVCKHGHEWEANFLNRSHGKGCPDCAGMFWTQQQTRRWLQLNIDTFAATAAVDRRALVPESFFRVRGVQRTIIEKFLDGEIDISDLTDFAYKRPNERIDHWKGEHRTWWYGSRGRKNVQSKLRQATFERDGHCCLACGSTDDLTPDHIILYARGGEEILENLQTLCFPCNRRKSSRLITLDELRAEIG